MKMLYFFALCMLLCSATAQGMDTEEANKNTAFINAQLAIARSELGVSVEQSKLEEKEALKEAFKRMSKSDGPLMRILGTLSSIRAIPRDQIKALRDKQSQDSIDRILLTVARDGESAQITNLVAHLAAHAVG